MVPTCLCVCVCVWLSPCPVVELPNDGFCGWSLMRGDWVGRSLVVRVRLILIAMPLSVCLSCLDAMLCWGRRTVHLRETLLTCSLARSMPYRYTVPTTLVPTYLASYLAASWIFWHIIFLCRCCCCCWSWLAFVGCYRVEPSRVESSCLGWTGGLVWLGCNEHSFSFLSRFLFKILDWDRLAVGGSSLELSCFVSGT